MFNFTENKPGTYEWAPSATENIGEVGESFTLNIQLNGEVFESTTMLAPSAQIDSIAQETRKDEFGSADGIYAILFARDVPGLGNAYWIKSFKNNQFLNKPQEINLAYDAAFDPGAMLDGTLFIPPIREFINRVPDSEGPDDGDVAPWAPGDSIRVEIHSLSVAAFSFMEIARDQMTNGDNTIFALPLANAKGNIVNTSGGRDPLGMFNVAEVSSIEKRIDEE